jgi:hypothetical protein
MLGNQEPSLHSQCLGHHGCNGYISRMFCFPLPTSLSNPSPARPLLLSHSCSLPPEALVLSSTIFLSFQLSFLQDQLNGLGSFFCFCFSFWWDWVLNSGALPLDSHFQFILLWLFCPGSPQTMILPISASQVASITGTSHWHLAPWSLLWVS